MITHRSEIVKVLEETRTRKKCVFRLLTIETETGEVLSTRYCEGEIIGDFDEYEESGK